MTPDPPGDPPVLDYATPRFISRQAELDQYVQHLIAQGAGPRDIRRYFRKDHHAIQYFCGVKRPLHGIDRLGDQCVSCGAEAKDLAIKLQWRVELKVYYLDVPLTGPPGRALGTFHPICAACARKWRGNLRWDLLRRGFFWFIVLGLALGLLGQLARAWRQAGTVRDDLFSIAYIVAFFLAIGLSRFLVNRAVRACRPGGLNRLMPAGVRFVRCGGVIPRKGA